MLARHLTWIHFVAILVTALPDSLSADEPRPRWQAPPLAQAVSVRDGKTDEVMTLAKLLDALADADVVFLGESHTDETTHRVELAIYEGLIARRQSRVALALEMFDRDVQPSLDAYVAGDINEETFLEQVRPWQNYRTGYRPLIERAKQSQLPVVASNFPRSLVRRIAMEGPQVLKSLADEQKASAPAELLPQRDEYWRRVDNAMRGHAGMMGQADRLHSTQSLWDNAMGDACARALDQYPDHSVLHINGDFHSAYWDGATSQLQQRRPQASVKTVSIVPVANPSIAEQQGAPVADYVVFAEGRAAGLNEGYWSVYTQSEIKYLLHLPEKATDQQPVPLLIWLVDRGLTAKDGFDLCRQWLGEEVAVAVLEPPFRERQFDLSVGGRWFWASSFDSDIGNAIDAIERVWAYVARHYPVDADRVCVAGEGTGATVAASTALLTGRMDVNVVAHNPRQYSKLKDYPLPLPESWGDQQPPARALNVWSDEQDQTWWTSELAAYRDVGLRAELHPVKTDQWHRETQLQNAIRTALGLPSHAPHEPPDRRYLLIENNSARARHWGRLQSGWLSGADGPAVAVVNAPPTDDSATAIPVAIQAEQFVGAGALPRCPGPFGGTTVVVLSADTSESERQEWLALEENDPLAKASRFYRLRVATDAGDRSLHTVLAKLNSENRKNVLIIPAEFCAGSARMQSLERSVHELADQMTLRWLPGLGGRRATLATIGAQDDVLPVRHDLTVSLDPGQQTILVDDRIQLPASLRKEGTMLQLASALKILRSSPNLQPLDSQEEQGTTAYQLLESASDGVLEIRYEGTMDFGLSDQQEEYTRGFRETRGTVCDDGVYLDGDSDWIPTFGTRMVRFKLAVELPESWHVVSQGKGTSRDVDGWARWETENEMEQVHLVGGPLFRESDTTGAVEIMTFLREEDAALSRKYLDTGARYLEMYRSLIGPYPYDKFAVIENFWETGYAMPSFTLLGPQVIRFPFILHSSYPHEILHNWWGNSVFVDYEQGNWCEGLTAYLADHLIQEQRGQGAVYRRNTLQKYRDYVRAGRDFPLAEFRSRHNAATEAVGYGKALMMFHMLRRQVGDDAFRAGLVSFYRKHRGRRASFDDLRETFETATGSDLTQFVTQWVERPGAPDLAIRDVSVVAEQGGFAIHGSLDQEQSADPFALEVPLVIQFATGSRQLQTTTTDRNHRFRLPVDERPLSIAVDPEFDVFRLLDPRETPASAGQLFGQSKILAVLPASTADAASLIRYREMLQTWQTEDHEIEFILDSELQSLPDDQSIWLLGKTNRFAIELIDATEDAARLAGDEGVVLAGENVPFADHSIVLVGRHPNNVEQAIGWLVVDPPAAFAGMTRKLPHYGKYSYLAFAGPEPTNSVKGQWSPAGSPLIADLRDDQTERLSSAPPEPRAALAELPPVFSTRELSKHASFLAAPAQQGRGLGTEGLEQSRLYIAKVMEEAGLTPGGDDGSWFQRFTVAAGPAGQPMDAFNVVGILPGQRDDWSEQSVVLGAHYDHLGRGWPDVHSGNEGQVHPGADDNASGVAVMLEMARVLSAEGGGNRNLVFVAFSAEECGRLGSIHYAENPCLPLEKIRGVINLDAVGRMFDRPLTVFGTSTADEWQHIFRGCSFVTGIPSKNVPTDVGGSDQVSFIERGIPGVQIFTGTHGDYHRPSDTVDKLDMAGMVKTAAFVKEAITYMLDREPPLTVQIAGARSQAAPATANQTGRKVLFGAVPAFDYQGDGVRFDDVVPDSPAAQAGLQAGDILVRLDDEQIGDLRAFSEFLKRLQPDQEVTATVTRDGQKLTVPVTVQQR